MKRPSRKSIPLPEAEPGLQFAALPWRNVHGLEILLVTSRESRRWVAPKGWPMKGLKAHVTAAREALEEAGVTGRVGKSPLGAYHYIKRLKNGAPLFCRVEVFPLKVQRQRKSWPEQHQRTVRWFPVGEAAAAVDEPELRQMIETFGRTAPGDRPKKAPPRDDAALSGPDAVPPGDGFDHG